MATDTAIDLGSEVGAQTPPDWRAHRAFLPKALHFLYGVLALQFVSTIFFVGSLWSEVLGLRTTSIPYAWQEYIEVMASLGLLSGTLTTILFVQKSRRKEKHLRRQIDVVAGNFEAHLADQFDDWSLSPSEAAVAVYAMKGFSNAEVADLRGTSAATVKSQLNAIYRKSGCANRQQLISFLVEELLSGVAVADERGMN